MIITTHRIRARAARARAGFTLIELLVSMTLTMFLMTILVEAFSTAADTFSGSRAVGDMQAQLRTAVNTLRFDLSRDHFDGSRKLSDTNFWNEPRREGFFFVRSTAAVNEGADWAGLLSERATNNLLHFTVHLKGNRRSDYFAIPGASFPVGTRTTANNMPRGTQMFGSELGLTSQWAEVCYWLQQKQAGDPTPWEASEGAPCAAGPLPPVPLFKLYRTHLLVLPFTDTVTPASIIPVSAGAKVSRNTANTKFFSPNDLAKDPSNRGISPWNPAATPGVLLLDNVVSFQVRALDAPVTSATRFKKFSNGTQSVNMPPLTTFDVFETGDTSLLTSPSTPRLGGIQIILRIFDPSSGMTRQATLFQDM